MSTRNATDVFSEWALIDRDEGMESGHAKSVNEMLNIVIPMLKKPFSAIDVGCGNGWVVLEMVNHPECNTKNISNFTVKNHSCRVCVKW